MFASGLVEEVRGLGDRYPGEWPGRLAIGYREVLGVLAGEPGPRELPDRLRAAEERVVIATRRYAKRQLTWFRAERDVTWVRGAAGDPAALEGAERVFLG